MAFRYEQNLPEKHMDCLASNCETYRVIADKIAVMINFTKHNLAQSNWESLARRSICNYLILGIQRFRLVTIELMQQCKEMNLAQMTRTYEIILQTRQLSWTGIASDRHINLWWVNCLFDDLKFRFLCSFCVLIQVFFCQCKSFPLLLGSRHPLSKIASNYRETWCFITQDFRKVLCLSCKSLSDNWITAEQRDYSMSSIFS